MAELKLDLAVDSSKAVRGVKDFSKALDDVVDDLEKVSDEGKDTGRDLERVFRDVARDAKKAGDDGGKDLSSGLKKGTDDFKSEASDTAREAAASFDGSAESIGDAFQEVAANAFSGFGPAGAAAGLAAAAGIGLVVAGFEAAAEAQKVSEEAIADWADAYIEAGGSALTAGILAARFQDIITDPEKFKTAEENARKWGVSIETAVAAMSGNQGAIDDVTASVDLLREAFLNSQSTADPNLYGDVASKVGEAGKAYSEARESLEKLTGEMETGSDRAQLLSGYYEDLINSTHGATVEVDELGNKLYSLPDGTQVYVDAETGQASQNVDNFKGDLDGIPDKVDSKVNFNVDDWNVRNYQPPNKTAYVTYRGIQPI
jgi:hypothetical protein